MKFSLNKLTLKSLLFLCLIALVSCSKDSDDPTPADITVTTSDFSKTIDENPSIGQVIGTLQGTTNEGSVTFSITEQSPSGSFLIDASSGELKVADVAVFNFETNPIITGTVKVANGAISKNALITIMISDVNEEKVFDGDVLLSTQNEINEFGNAGYTHITGHLIISNPDYDDIIDLVPLSNLAKIDGFVSIDHCEKLTTLNGLSNLSYLGDNFSIFSNASLTSLAEFKNLTSIEGNLSLDSNYNLAEFVGFSSLTSVGGNLYIGDSVFTNLDGFVNLKSIGGLLSISFTYYLNNLDGLSNLEFIGSQITISNNERLNNIDALESLTSTISELRVSYNPLLQNISGLQNINVKDKLRITNNALLSNIEGLLRISNLFSILISRNSSLSNLDGLSNLKVVTNDLNITYNNNLTNLNGLSGLTNVDGNMEITNNLILNDFCGLRNFMTNGSLGSYEFARNLYNPTKQDIIDGNCSI